MAEKSFSTSNPEAFRYTNAVQQITVLGGVKLEGLDRMRVTLKIELIGSPRPPVRHNLDLYNDNQVEKLLRKVASKHEVGLSVVGASIAELTNQLENYRLEAVKELNPDPSTTPALTHAAQQEATNFLGQADLLARTNRLIGRAGVIGEENNRLLMYLIFTSRLRPQPLHVVSLGSSGTGKTHLQEKVGELIPQEEQVGITTLSENAFYYFGQQELRNKLILIEDLDGAEGALYPLRELQSKKRISKTIAHKNTRGETRTIHLIVEGPICVAGCTTKESIYEDNANRSFLLYLDESPEQDKRIMDHQRAMAAGKVDRSLEQEAVQLLQNVQRTLKPLEVINPFAQLLVIPQEVFKPRRTNAHYLQFIEVVTFYHQYQREQRVNPATGEIFIETTLQDIALANELLKPVLLRKSDELSGATRDHLNRLKAWLADKNRTAFGNREISRELKKPIATVKRHHSQLLQLGYLSAKKQPKAKGYLFALTQLANDKSREKLIHEALDRALQRVEEASGSTGSHQLNGGGEPLKPLNTSKKNEVAHSKSKKVDRTEKKQDNNPTEK